MSARGAADQGKRGGRRTPQAVTLDRRSLEQLSDGLALAFYLVILGALFAVITGSPGLAFVLLVLAGIAHVGRAGLEEFVAAEGDEAAVTIDLGAMREQAMERISRLRLPQVRWRTPAARRRR